MEKKDYLPFCRYYKGKRKIPIRAAIKPSFGIMNVYGLI